MRHSTRDRSPFRVRLACVKHAASVQSEPESNSPVQICSRSLLGRNQNLKVVLFPFALRLSMNQADLRPSPFLAALGCMNLFRGAVNNFFCEPRKNFLKRFFSVRLRQPAKVEPIRFRHPRQELFCPGSEIPSGKIRGALASSPGGGAGASPEGLCLGAGKPSTRSLPSCQRRRRLLRDVFPAPMQAFQARRRPALLRSTGLLPALPFRGPRW